MIVSLHTLAVLRRADILLRKFVRATLHLPHDCPNVYLHTTVADGGLGVVSLRVEIPELREARLDKQRNNMAISALMGEAGDLSW